MTADRGHRMNVMRYGVVAILIAISLFIAGCSSGWSEDIQINKGDLASVGSNPYFKLTPGYTLVFQGKEKGKVVQNTIKVLDETKTVDGVETRVVEERELADNRLVEVSRNYFAISKSTKTVYYFGEDVDDYDPSGTIIGHEGTWHAGIDKAKAGIMMLGSIENGERYYQEIAPKVAMDRAEVISVDETLSVPYGSYKKVIKIEETTPLEPDTKSFKLYAKGIGLIKDGDLLLVNVINP